MKIHRTLPIAALLILTACGQSEPPRESVGQPEVAVREAPATQAAAEQPSRYDIYATVRLTADLSHLNDQLASATPLLAARVELAEEHIRSDAAQFQSEVIRARERARMEAMAFEI